MFSRRQKVLLIFVQCRQGGGSNRSKNVSRKCVWGRAQPRATPALHVEACLNGPWTVRAKIVFVIIRSLLMCRETIPTHLVKGALRCSSVFCLPASPRRNRQGYGVESFLKCVTSVVPLSHKLSFPNWWDPWTETEIMQFWASLVGSYLDWGVIELEVWESHLSGGFPGALFMGLGPQCLCTHADSSTVL